MIVENGTEDQLEVDLSSKLQEQHSKAKEVLDDSIPDPIFGELAITAYANSNHAHDKVGHLWHTSLKKGAVETPTYGAKFMKMKTAVERVMTGRGMLRCLGVK
eukprot:13024380-Ditylum_brightwellii.AAC.1